MPTVTGRAAIFATIAVTLLSQNAAFALPQRHPGLWRQTTDITITSNPEFTPELRKLYSNISEGAKGTKYVCVTAEMNHFEKQVTERSQALLKSKVCETGTQETEFTSTLRMVCRKPGPVTTMNTTWKGDTNFTSDMNTKTLSDGRSIESKMHIVGEFVGTECGNVKAPFVPHTLGIQNDRGPGEPPLFEAFNRYCIETRANYDQIAKIADAPGSIFRPDPPDSAKKAFRWQVGGPFTYLTAYTSQPRGARDFRVVCEMQTQRVDAASLEAMRQWLGPKEMPTLGWYQDFVWDRETPTPVFMKDVRSLIAAGKTVWHLDVSKSQPGKDTRFTLSRYTDGP
jgi:hypothetical protein